MMQLTNALPLLTLLSLLSCGEGTAPAPPPQGTEPVREVAATEQVAPVRAVETGPETATMDTFPNVAYLTGKFDPATHPDFVKVDDRYGDGDPYLLHRETYAAFQEMHAAAARDDVELTIVSATRNFDRQKQIWEAKWNGRRLLEGRDKADEVYPDPADRARAILRYSSMPGTSRHHWGTDIDLNALDNSYFEQGEGKRVYDWLLAHAADYGFCQPYTAKGADRPSGYEEEKWHWSFLPLATRLTNFAASRMDNGDIGGFDGQGAAGSIDVVNSYVLGINPACRESN